MTSSLCCGGFKHPNVIPEVSAAIVHSLRDAQFHSGSRKRRQAPKPSRENENTGPSLECIRSSTLTMLLLGPSHNSWLPGKAGPPFTQAFLTCLSKVQGGQDPSSSWERLMAQHLLSLVLDVCSNSRNIPVPSVIYRSPTVEDDSFIQNIHVRKC